MQSVLHRPAVLVWAAALAHACAVSVVSLQAQAAPQVTPPANALPASRTGEDIYRAACVTCHALDGRGSPRSVVGFDIPIRDFTDCTATAETSPDWQAVVHEGGPVRGLNRHMPSFGEALTGDDIAKVVDYIRTFCAGKGWPLGDLNFPRAFFTEKAFPENETVWTTSVNTKGEGAVGNTLVYERRFGARNQIEAVVPVNFQEGEGGSWVRGLGDVAFAFRRTFLANNHSGTIAAAGAEVALPTGKESQGLGNGYSVFEPFAMWGQALPKDSYLQMHGGMEIPSNQDLAPKEAYLRTAIGTTFTQDRGFGRAWSPQVELLWARPFGEQSEWDVVPQLQVSLSKLQHILLAGGVRMPLNLRDERKPQVLVYFLWDWFDGGLFQFWK